MSYPCISNKLCFLFAPRLVLNKSIGAPIYLIRFKMYLYLLFLCCCHLSVDDLKLCRAGDGGISKRINRNETHTNISNNNKYNQQQ